MSQFDWGIMDPDAVSGTTLATDLNSFRDALYSAHRGTSRPSYAVAGLIWQDTSASPNIMKRWDGTRDVIIGYVDETAGVWMPAVGGGTNTITAGATTDLGSVSGSHVVISGSATITSFGTSMLPGQIKTVVFGGGATVTHNDTALNLPTGGNVTVSAEDRMVVVCTSSGNYYVMQYVQAGSSTGELAGVIKKWAGLDLPAGYLWSDGSAVSRTTFATLFNAITRQTTGNTTSASPTITSVVNTARIAVGMPISGPGIPAGSMVRSFVANTSISLGSISTGAAVNATATATGVAIVIAPHGVGDGSTTFNLPNHSGRTAVGRDDLSGGAANVGQVSTTMTTSNGSNGATVASAAGMFVGMYILCANVPLGTTVTQIVGLSITLSSGTGVVAGTNAAVRFSPYQDAQRLGAIGGELGHTITLADLPTGIASNGTATIGTIVANGGGAHVPGTAGSITGQLYNNGGGALGNNFPSSTSGGAGDWAAVTLTGSGTAAVTSNNTGALAHNNADPKIVMGFIIKT